MVEGTHIVFLGHITGNRYLRNSFGMWSTPDAEEVQEASETQLATPYIGII